jgi:hypothetical protein
VFFDRGHVNFNSLQVGRKAQETVRIINKEKIPLTFQLDKSSFIADDKVINHLFCNHSHDKQVLQITPIKGIVGADSEQPISLLFAPNLEKKYNFNLNWIISRKPTSLSLNLKGEGYAIKDSLLLDYGNKEVLTAFYRRIAN